VSVPCRLCRGCGAPGLLGCQKGLSRHALAPYWNARWEAHGHCIVGKKRDDDVGFGRDRLPILDVRTVAPLPNGARCSRC